MPKVVDHEQRRRQIAHAAAGIATTRGVQGVTFREVASAAGVSVALVQHYFGTKDRLLVDILDLQSASLGTEILDDIARLGPDARPLDRVSAIAGAFLPTDARRRESMLLYLGFAGAALTDDSLRRAEAFTNGRTLINTITNELRIGIALGDVDGRIDPESAAQALVALILGLSMSVLLEQSSIDAAEKTLVHQLAGLCAG